jgi:hypothetical protein
VEQATYNFWTCWKSSVTTTATAFAAVYSVESWTEETYSHQAKPSLVQTPSFWDGPDTFSVPMMTRDDSTCLTSWHHSCLYIGSESGQVSRIDSDLSSFCFPKTWVPWGLVAFPFFKPKQKLVTTPLHCNWAICSQAKGQLYYLAQAAITKYHRLVTYTAQIYFLIILEAGSSRWGYQHGSFLVVAFFVS